MAAPFYLQRLFTDRCCVYGYESYRRADGSTGSREVLLLENIPCRLSFDNIKRVYETNTVSHLTQTVRLFTPPETVIPEGSAVVLQRGQTELRYKSSGIPAVYETHREYLLEQKKTRA